MSQLAPIPLALVVNLAARGVRRRYLSNAPFWCSLLAVDSVRLTSSLEELNRAIVEFREAGVRMVAGLGGDGTLHHLAEAVLRHYPEASAPVLVALAGGTMNGLPRALGSGGNPIRVLRQAIAAASVANPQVQARHLLAMEDTITGRTRYGFGFAAGLVYRAFEEYYRHPEPGLLDALRASLLPILSPLLGGGRFYHDATLQVEVGGSSWLPEPIHTVVASVVDNPVLWFRPFGAPLKDASLFHLAGLAMKPREIMPRLWSIFRGRCRHPRLRVGQVAEVTVRGGSGYLIDGDLYPSKDVMELHVSLGPRLRFFVPASA